MTVDVSAVIATNRVDQYFYEALDSLFTQRDVNLEVVLVLDGVDWPLSERAPFVDNDLTVLALETHHGTPTALNKGIEVARNDLILRLDADDIAVPDRAALQARFLGEHPHVVAVGARAALIDAAGNHLGSSTQAPPGPLNRLLLRRNPIVHSTLMMRKSAWRAAGGYDPRCLRMQDYELYLRLARIGELRTLNQTLSLYRVHTEQNSRRSYVIAPWTRQILASRRELARSLGYPRITVTVNNIAWLTWQVLRQNRVVRPRHLHRLARRR